MLVSRKYATEPKCCVKIHQRPCQLAWAFLLCEGGECDVTKKDIRVLCSQHAKEVIYAKFALTRTNNQIKSECDKCKNQGWEYFIKK